MPNKDNDHTEDNSTRKLNYLSKSSNKERTEIKQTNTHWNQASEVYFDLIKMQSMARTKHTAKKKVIREGKMPPKDESGKVP